MLFPSAGYSLSPAVPVLLQNYTFRVFFVDLFRSFQGDCLAMDKSASTARLYSDVGKEDTGIEPSSTWLRDYQREDEEEAVERAIEESVKVTISASRTSMKKLYRMTSSIRRCSFLFPF